MRGEDRLKIALDELRMQMLGAQVLFGFSLQGAFQTGFDDLPAVARWLDALGTMLVITTLGLLIAPACQHRLVERGRATPRILGIVDRCANWALFLFAITLGCNAFVATARVANPLHSLALALALMFAALAAWFGAPRWLRSMPEQNDNTRSPAQQGTELHGRIDQMLTEARVILPGAQALLGFQFIAMLTSAFEKLPPHVRVIHLVALCAVALAVILLIAPAAIHRMTFQGTDSERFHGLGSFIVSLALVPLILGISMDAYVAGGRMLNDERMGVTLGSSTFAVLALLWYVIPLALRRSKINRERLG